MVRFCLYLILITSLHTGHCIGPLKVTRQFKHAPGTLAECPKKVFEKHFLVIQTLKIPSLRLTPHPTLQNKLIKIKENVYHIWHWRLNRDRVIILKSCKTSTLSFTLNSNNRQMDEGNSILLFPNMQFCNSKNRLKSSHIKIKQINNIYSGLWESITFVIFIIQRWTVLHAKKATYWYPKWK